MTQADTGPLDAMKMRLILAREERDELGIENEKLKRRVAELEQDFESVLRGLRDYANLAGRAFAHRT